MKPTSLFVALLLSGASMAQAAPAPYLLLDHSTETLMNEAAAQAMWKDRLTTRLLKVYPAAKWGFLTEVEGGFDEAKMCVVTARAMILPRSGKTLVFKPAKTATAFGAMAGASMDQCRALAKTKLGEAADGVVSALLRR